MKSNVSGNINLEVDSPSFSGQNTPERPRCLWRNREEKKELENQVVVLQDEVDELESALDNLQGENKDLKGRIAEIKKDHAEEMFKAKDEI